MGKIKKNRRRAVYILAFASGIKPEGRLYRPGFSVTRLQLVNESYGKGEGLLVGVMGGRSLTES